MFYANKNTITFSKFRICPTHFFISPKIGPLQNVHITLNFGFKNLITVRPPSLVFNTVGL